MPLASAVAAALTAVASAALMFFVMRSELAQGPVHLPTPPPDFDSVVCIPPNAPREEPDDDDGMPSRGQFEMARIDAWVLTHGIFEDLKSGKITREKAVESLRRLTKRVRDDDISLFEINEDATYTQAGENAPLAYLLDSAISNLVIGAEK